MSYFNNNVIMQMLGILASSILLAGVIITITAVLAKLYYNYKEKRKNETKQ